MAYGLPDPLSLLNHPAMSKPAWKELIDIKITAYHEAELRKAARSNRKLEYFNVDAVGQSISTHIYQ